MTILHLSADYPDPLAPAKTKAIRNLLGLAQGYDHRVYSLNRVGPHAPYRSESFEDGIGAGHLAIRYPGLPKGLFHRRYLLALAEKLIEEAVGQGLRPALVHAHKLSVEALAGERVAAHFGVPLVISAQGGSDLRIIGLKRDIRADYRRIWHGASVIFPFAPWTGAGLTRLLGQREGPTPVLPVASAAEPVFEPGPEVVEAPRIVSVFHLDVFKRKNAQGLIQGAAMASKRISGLRLQIAGGGSPRAEAAMRKLVETHGEGVVDLLGPLDGAGVRALMQSATAFAMPSLEESFGMVFVEALHAGCPVIFPQGAAIDGYLGTVDWAVPCKARDEGALAEAMVAMVLKGEERRAKLRQAAQSGALEVFSNRTIGQTYREGLAGVLSGALAS